MPLPIPGRNNPSRDSVSVEEKPFISDDRAYPVNDSPYLVSRKNSNPSDGLLSNEDYTNKKSRGGLGAAIGKESRISQDSVYNRLQDNNRASDGRSGGLGAAPLPVPTRYSEPLEESQHSLSSGFLDTSEDDIPEEYFGLIDEDSSHDGPDDGYYSVDNDEEGAENEDSSEYDEAERLYEQIMNSKSTSGENGESRENDEGEVFDTEAYSDTDTGFLDDAESNAGDGELDNSFEKTYRESDDNNAETANSADFDSGEYADNTEYGDGIYDDENFEEDTVDDEDQDSNDDIYWDDEEDAGEEAEDLEEDDTEDEEEEPEEDQGEDKEKKTSALALVMKPFSQGSSSFVRFGVILVFLVTAGWLVYNYTYPWGSFLGEDIPDEGQINVSVQDYDAQSDTVNFSVENSGNVIVDAGIEFTVYTTQIGFNPVSWFVPQKLTTCYSDEVFIEMDEEVVVDAQCEPFEGDGFWLRSGVNSVLL